MNENFIFVPLIIHLAAATIMLFAWGRIKFQRWFAILSNAAALIVASALFGMVWNQGIVTVQSGGWKPPFGITMVADTLAASLVLLTSIVGLAVSIFAAGTIIPQRVKYGFFPILQILFLGLCGAFLTGDLFSLYVWFEIIIISSFVLLTIGGEKMQLEGAVNYFTLNMLSSLIFLTAIAIIYGITGTLNMADVAMKLPLVEHPHLVEVTAIFFLAGFGTKAAIFPFYFWLPSSYHTPPDAVSAVFGGLLTKMGVYAIIRVFSLLYADNALISEIITIAAGCTILAGGAAALVQNNLRRLFSYLIICHIGFMIAGIGIGSVLAITGVIFYLFHDIIVKTNLFMVAGLTHRMTGTSSIRDLGGIYDKYPMLALLMAVPLFSLVGIPPLSGFWPKIGLISAGFTDHKWIISGLIILGSFFTLIAIAKLWAEVFWKPSKEIYARPNFTFWNKLGVKRKLLYLVPIGFLAALSLFIGLGAGVIEPVAERVALELSDTMIYVNAVFKTKQ